jgi:hypothetical protein
VVLAADLDGDGRDEVIAGPMSRSVHAFDASTACKWFEAGSPVNNLLASPATEDKAACGGRRIGRPEPLDAVGNRFLNSSSLVVTLVTVEKAAAATADGVRRLVIRIAVRRCPESISARAVSPAAGDEGFAGAYVGDEPAAVQGATILTSTRRASRFSTWRQGHAAAVAFGRGLRRRAPRGVPGAAPSSTEPGLRLRR